MKRLKLVKQITLLFLSIIMVLPFSYVDVSAFVFQEPEPISNKEKAHRNIPFTDGGGEKENCLPTGGKSDGGLDGFLRALAMQESGGDPKIENTSSSASGKYQYIDGTWRSRVSGDGAIYPPGNIYSRAKDAPEAVQDAVAYIEYSKKFKEFNEDLFKLAVSHFYPAANENEDLLDKVPPGNVITPREYGEAVVKKVEEGYGGDLPLLYKEAPEFDKYATIKPAGDSPNPRTATKTIFIDPGHGAAVSEYTDEITKLRDRETSNSPESTDVLKVAKRVKSKLEGEGYTVKLARNNNENPVNKRERVNLAKGSDLAVSIHTTPGGINQTWPQRVNTYREYESAKVTFSDEGIANRSEKYAIFIAEARKKAENREVGLDPNNTQQMESFSREGVPSKGNISLVQLWGKDVPWVYNEFGLGTSEGLSESDIDTYTTGLVQGIQKSIPLSGNPSDPGCGLGGPGVGAGIEKTTLAYAWPEFHEPNYFEMTPDYKKAVRRATESGRYVGGEDRPGIDCGGFVTTLLVDSGFEPKYNHSGKMSDGAGNTPTQEAWVKNNWKSLGYGKDIDTATLEPGDVAFSGGPSHTFVYVGNIEGFNSPVASASYSPSNTSWRSPMAGQESLTTGDVRWYRKD